MRNKIALSLFRKYIRSGAQKNYPGMRTITGEYVMREITLK
jgi:hypothetical protein